MNSYKYKSIVSNTEAEALKEMIFKRARERAESLKKEVQGDYTNAVYNDVMDIARNSFAQTKNPFIFDEEKEDVFEKENVVSESENETKKDLQIGFSTRKNSKTKSVALNAIVNYKAEEVLATMSNAHAELSNKKSFVGALDFLNSQACLSLLSSKTGKFEVIA